ncbi:MAG: hypothetical protein Q7K57_15365 [Burkholderiaceae bacterium]|nr:hypothetical protein [Burkholderiaceae bacterium]
MGAPPRTGNRALVFRRYDPTFKAQVDTGQSVKASAVGLLAYLAWAR